MSVAGNNWFARGLTLGDAPPVLGEGEEPTPLPVVDVYPHFVSVVFAGDTIAPPEVQEQRLRKRRERAEGGPARAAKRLERLMSEWQVTALTPMRAAELLVAAGLRPGRDL
ncbi:hypothetical protein [Limnoglobus roseus]|uniref:Uncharacterized protein n=1 Tax=Limnoglobus roseus TaxID=2598579 RepID=A0A5C1AK97_9BACT|nr:hypothetical protein [Limnoglobus roseus]QEL18623.1 hypothetical protein PX52LOC_05656 [Limnoglobus roseus]